MCTIEERVLSALDECFAQASISQHTPVGVAFSGGSDSLALLHAVCRRINRPNIHPIYVNHRLRSRAELEREQLLNEANCHALGLKLTIIDLGEGAVADEARRRGRGIEEAARHLRYEALLRHCHMHSITVLLTAHNSDDQLETLLMRFAHASSISALAAIRRRRLVADVTILRPLLPLSHRDLAEYVRGQGLASSEDSTNSEAVYLRNRLRKEVKKPLLSLFPNARQSATTLARRFEETARILESLIDQALQKVSVDEGGSLRFEQRWFASLDGALAELLLYRMVGMLEGDARIAQSSIEALKRGLSQLEGRSQPTLDIGPYRLERDGQMVILSPIAVTWSYSMSLSEPSCAQVIALPGGVEVVIASGDRGDGSDSGLRIDASHLIDPVIRSVRSFDEIALAKATVRVGKLLSGQGIAPHLRAQVPILVDRSGVVAVFGAAFGGRDRIAERFKAPLAHPFTNIYSSNRRVNYSEI